MATKNGKKRYRSCNSVLSKPFANKLCLYRNVCLSKIFFIHIRQFLEYKYELNEFDLPHWEILKKYFVFYLEIISVKNWKKNISVERLIMLFSFKLIGSINLLYKYSYVFKSGISYYRICKDLSKSFFLGPSQYIS